MSFTLARPSQPLNPPALGKREAIHLWFGNRKLKQTIEVAERQLRDAQRSRSRHKEAAGVASRRCADLESRIAALESRAAAAEALVEVLLTEIVARGTQESARALKQKLLSLVRFFHPDKLECTTPTQVTQQLNALIAKLHV
jgi:uncharacterized coiled-coil protein SlyX